jgi:hypothetical protein
MKRIIAIWIFGLLGSGIVGTFIVDALETGYNPDSAFFGFIGGAFLFACIRLWIKEPPKNSN